jgi:hypothetical protein
MNRRWMALAGLGLAAIYAAWRATIDKTPSRRVSS